MMVAVDDFSIIEYGPDATILSRQQVHLESHKEALEKAADLLVQLGASPTGARDIPDNTSDWWHFTLVKGTDRGWPLAVQRIMELNGEWRRGAGLALRLGGHSWTFGVWRSGPTPEFDVIGETLMGEDGSVELPHSSPQALTGR
jgi:hypothetical protein